MSTHSQLVERAVRWLYGTKRCNVVLAGNASCAEVPDAIGWSTARKNHGSIVVECKTSVSDFHRDKRKKHEARMGDWRYFLVPIDIASAPAIAEASVYPDHGLLLLGNNGRIQVVREAPERLSPDTAAEIRALQFALVHVFENLTKHGCTVDMCQLTKFHGKNGITFPQPKQGALHGPTVSSSPA